MCVCVCVCVCVCGSPIPAYTKSQLVSLSDDKKTIIKNERHKLKLSQIYIYIYCPQVKT